MCVSTHQSRWTLFGLAYPMRRLLALFLLQDGRKVGFGLWVFCAAGGFLLGGRITASDWLMCVFLSSGLIGGGTVLESYIKGKNAPNTR